jgi:hypothetical protein
VWEHYLQLVAQNPLRLTLGARGQDQVRGEDTDLVLAAIDLGLGLGRFPILRLEHIIPAGRLTVTYLDNLIAGVNLGTGILEYIRYGRVPAPLAASWPERLLLAYRARRLPEPLRTFYQAELRGRASARAQIKAWQGRPPAAPSGPSTIALTT